MADVYYEKIQEARDAIRRRVPDFTPDAGVILGSGLGRLAEEVEDSVRVPYAEIPNFPRSTVLGHHGELVLGRLEGVSVVVMRGRVHYYEGYTMREVTFPVRVIQALGAGCLVVTNASGGIRDDLRPGDLMLINDHINLTGSNPLLGPNDERLGPRFPPMAHAYDPELREVAHRVATGLGFRLKEGVYVGLAGPSFETPAEIRFFGMIGADAVGMSTVSEVIVARHGNMRVLGISCVTNVLHEGPSKDTHEDVLAAADRSGPRFISLVRGVIRELPAVARAQ
ncbi:MAG: purine-nucleoside phosphorylase [Candidatus Eremiobacterota bacterium]